MAPVSDPCSLCSISECVTRHVNLFYYVDFDSHVLKGNVALTVEVLQEQFSELVKPLHYYYYSILYNLQVMLASCESYEPVKLVY